MSVSLKMDKIEYRAVIKFFVKEGLTSNVIQSKFINVYGDYPRIVHSGIPKAYNRWYSQYKCNSIIKLLCLTGICILYESEVSRPSPSIAEVRNKYNYTSTQLYVLIVWTGANLFAFFWRDSPQWATASSFLRFLDHTQRRNTVGRTPLDE